jgi:hypothetical protein
VKAGRKRRFPWGREDTIWPDRQLPCPEIGIGMRGGRITELLFGKVSREFPNYTLECRQRLFLFSRQNV